MTITMAMTRVSELTTILSSEVRPRTPHTFVASPLPILSLFGPRPFLWCPDRLCRGRCGITASCNKQTSP